MAASSTTASGSLVYERHERVHRYHWPADQLNFWMLIMLISSCTIIGIFANFIQIQNQLGLGVPWCVVPHPSLRLARRPKTDPSRGRYFPYFITVASIVLVYVGLLLYLIYNRRLLPSIVMLGGFMLFILWLVGLIVISIQLWGPTGSVSSNCNLSVFSQNPTGQTLNTLAWLEQKSICTSPWSV